MLSAGAARASTGSWIRLPDEPGETGKEILKIDLRQPQLCQSLRTGGMLRLNIGMLITILYSGPLVWLFSPALNAFKLTLEFGFICPFVVIDPTD